jgi:hypothetical protein
LLGAIAREDAPGLRLGWLVLCLGALVALCYGAGLHDFFLSDDFGALGQHSGKCSVGVHLGLVPREPILFLRPLTDLSWWFNSSLGGLDPLGYHLLNCAFHLANALLVAQLTFSLGKSLVAAWIAGACFASFPLHAEAVTWLNGRVDVMCATGVLASLVCWARYCESDGRPLHFLGCLLAFLAALGFKEMAVTLPMLAAVIALGCFRGAGPRIWRGLAVVFATLFVYLLARWLYLGGVAGYRNEEGRSVFLNGSLLNALTFLRFSLEHVLLPSGWVLAKTPLSAVAFAAPLVWIAATAASFVLCVPRRTLLVALTFGALSLVSMAPVMGWVQYRPAAVTEGWRFLYLPSAFACAALGLSFSFASGPRPLGVRIAAAAMALLLLGSNVLGLRELNSRWHAASQLTASLVEGVRRRCEGSTSFPLLVYAAMPKSEQGVPVFHNGFDSAVQLWVSSKLQVLSLREWNKRVSSGAPLPADPPLRLAWDRVARVWRDV